MMQRLMMIMAGSISCKELDEKLDQYMEGDLSLVDRMRFKMHFLMCKACKAYAAGYAKTVALIKDSFCEINSQDADVPEDLINAIIDQQTSRPEGQG